jgi:hypothetical protein
MNSDTIIINNEVNKSGNYDSEENEIINVNTFRFKFAENITNMLYRFSKIHEHDNRNDFKEAWTLWREENEEELQEEATRLTQLGYKGDITDKMYKSARYYFRNKSITKPVQKDRKKYISLDNLLLITMDSHIKRNISNEDYTPQSGFLNFCETNMEILQETVNSLIKMGISDSSDIHNKVKKTYKNRYSMITLK